MNAQPNATEELMDEIARYLEAVDVYREERCEPTWLPEPARHDAVEKPARGVRGPLHATR